MEFQDLLLECRLRIGVLSFGLPPPERVHVHAAGGWGSEFGQKLGQSGAEQNAFGVEFVAAAAASIKTVENTQAG